MALSKRHRLGNLSVSTISTRSRPHANFIFKLDDDILWYIFSINADMDQETEKITPAMLTLQYTSQVCSTWRQLAIGLPTLWGRVLDFGLLWRKKAMWRNEVLRRIGQTAPLYIKVYLEGIPYTSPKTQDVERLLNTHWGRIRSLKLYIDINFYPLKDPWPRLLGRPAPHLQVFIFSFLWEGIPSFAPNPTLVLFGNDAPSLRVLSITDIALNLATLRVPNLRSLTLCPSIPVLDLLKALRHMPFLESLAVKRDDSEDGDGVSDSRNRPQVHLPQLTSMELNTNSCPSTCTLLNSITPSKECLLNFVDDWSEFTQHPGVEYFTALSTFSQHCTQLKNATNLEVVLKIDSLRAAVAFTSGGKFLIDLVLVESGGEGFSPEIISQFLMSFPTLRFDTIQKLHLSIAENSLLLQNSGAKNFILTLASVDYLEIDTQTLGGIAVIQETCPNTIIPALKTVYISSVYKPQQRFRITSFLHSRIQQGFPVDVLAVRIQPSIRTGLRTLSKIRGLTLQTTCDGKTFDDF